MASNPVILEPHDMRWRLAGGVFSCRHSSATRTRKYRYEGEQDAEVLCSWQEKSRMLGIVVSIWLFPGGGSAGRLSAGVVSDKITSTSNALVATTGHA